jgi:hypothetical protein
MAQRIVIATKWAQQQTYLGAVTSQNAQDVAEKLHTDMNQS